MIHSHTTSSLNHPLLDNSTQIPQNEKTILDPETGEFTIPKRKGRKPKLSMSKSESKRARLSNQPYLDHKGKLHEPKVMRQDIICCTKNCNQLVDNLEKCSIFEGYNAAGDTKRQQLILAECIRVENIKRHRPNRYRIKRTYTAKYFINQTEVCQGFLCELLQISKGPLKTVIKKMRNDNSFSETRGSNTNFKFKELDPERKQGVINHINRFEGSDQNTIVKTLFELYQKETENPVSYDTYRKIFRNRTLQECQRDTKPQISSHGEPCSSVIVPLFEPRTPLEPPLFESYPYLQQDMELITECKVECQMESSEQTVENDNNIIMDPMELNFKTGELSSQAKKKGRRPKLSMSKSDSKRARLNNERYIDYKGNIHEPKVMKQHITCCMKNCNDLVDEFDKHTLFEDYNAAGDTKTQQFLLSQCIQCENIKRHRTTNDEKKRSYSAKYFINQTEVCQGFLCELLQISRGPLKTVIKKMRNDISFDEMRGSKTTYKFKELDPERKQRVIEHINQFPNLEQGTRVMDLFKLYRKNTQNPVSYETYRKIFRAHFDNRVQPESTIKSEGYGFGYL